MLKSVRTLRELSGARGYPKRGFTRAKTPRTPSDGQGPSSRAEARDLGKISPFGRNDNALRPLRLCARYSEFRLRFGRAGFFVVKNPFLLSRSLLPHAYHPKIPLSIFSLSSPVPVL